MGENVRGLTNWNGGLVFDEVQADLEAEGYEVLPFLLPACAVNAPHRRDRIWFIAYSESFSCNDGTRNGKYFSQEIQKIRPNEPISTANTNTSGLPFGIQSGLGGNEKKTRTFAGSEFTRTFTTGNCFQEFPTQSPVCNGDDGLSSRLDGITFPKWRTESIKGGGNAIVSQVAFEIFKCIEKINNNIK